MNSCLQLFRPFFLKIKMKIKKIGGRLKESFYILYLEYCQRMLKIEILIKFFFRTTMCEFLF